MRDLKERDIALSSGVKLASKSFPMTSFKWSMINWVSVKSFLLKVTQGVLPFAPMANLGSSEATYLISAILKKVSSFMVNGEALGATLPRGNSWTTTTFSPASSHSRRNSTLLFGIFKIFQFSKKMAAQINFFYKNCHWKWHFYLEKRNFFHQEITKSSSVTALLHIIIVRASIRVTMLWIVCGTFDTWLILNLIVNWGGGVVWSGKNWINQKPDKRPSYGHSVEDLPPYQLYQVSQVSHDAWGSVLRRDQDAALLVWEGPQDGDRGVLEGHFCSKFWLF